MNENKKKYQIAPSLIEGIGKVLVKSILSTDALVEVLGWGFSKVASILLKAEFKGVIISLPGQIYKKSR